MAPHAIAERIAPLKPEFARLGLAALYLFGSQARGDATESSDVDFAFEVADEARFNLFDLYGLEARLAEVLDRKVDLVDLKCMRPRVRARVEDDLLRLY